MKKFLTNDFFQAIENESKIDWIEKKVTWASIFIWDKILVCQRTKDEFMPWLVELPSWNVEMNESLIEWLVREVKEETWLNINCVYSYVWYFDYLSWSWKKARQFNFLVTCDEWNVLINPDEHESYYLIDLDTINDFNISEKTKEIIKISFAIKNGIH